MLVWRLVSLDSHCSCGVSPSAKPLGNFFPSNSAKMLAIAACTQVHRTELASSVNSHSCDCNPGFLQLSISRPEGCADRKAAKIRVCTAQKYKRFTMKVQHCKSHGVLVKNAGSGSSGCISVRSCRSAAAAAFRECGASGSVSAARTSGPCAI